MSAEGAGMLPATGSGPMTLVLSIVGIALAAGGWTLRKLSIIK